MAYLNKLKDLRVLKPSSTEILYKTVLGDINIGPHEPDRIYQAGDKIYVIENGNTVIYECKNNDTVGHYNPDDWIVVDDILSSGSNTTNPNKPQPSTPVDNKILEDILNIQIQLGKLTDIQTTNVQKIDFTENEQVRIIGSVGKVEFGRIYF